jgi:hypothetical protein
MSDLIDRQALCDDLREYKVHPVPISSDESEVKGYNDGIDLAISVITEFPSAEPEPLSDAYMKAVWTWLLDYQIKMAELKGRYTPYEVLSWVANDWRKEHERKEDNVDAIH